MSRQTWISFQILHFCNQQNHFQQFGNTCFLMCGNRNHDSIAAPVFRDQLMLSKLLFYMIRISSGTIHFINGNDNRYLRCFCMVNSFERLRHNTVICSNYQNSNICYLCSTRTHSCKSFVTGSIKENNLFALIINLISTDMLRNTASFSCCNISLANSVKQRSFTMVNVTHNSDYRRPRQTFSRIIFHFRNFSRILFRR